jgi:hypothetical protein
MFFHILNIEREIYWQIGKETYEVYTAKRNWQINLQIIGYLQVHVLNLSQIIKIKQK